MAQELMTREQGAMLFAILVIGLLFACYTTVVVVALRRKRQLSHLLPPEDLTVVRGPGESLRKQAEQLLEQALQWLFAGSAMALVMLVAPLMLVKVWPALNPLFLFGSGVALFLAVSLYCMRRAFGMLKERNQKKLGWYGERVVAEILHRQGIEGAAYFHDVPMKQKGYSTNIDHLILTPKAVVVVETKMRSKPKNPPKPPIQVDFDGEKLDWPLYSNDTKTLQQVRRNADWTQQQVMQVTGRNLPVHGIVAIPGWRVIEKKLGTPRVVPGKGVADAARQLLGTSAGDQPLTSAQFAKLIEHFDQLCRDTEL